MDYEKYGEVFRKGNVTLINCDCMDLMVDAPENHWQLSIIDPPYGIGVSGQSGSANNDRWNSPIDKNYHSPDWDSKIPSKEYFDLLKRVSVNQIIWGANYFPYVWPSKGVICWDKKTTGNYSNFELAATTFNKPAKIFEWLWNGFRKQQHEDRIHPTQKPVKLYDWLLANYAKPGDRILDTHLGSGSSAIAAHYAGHDFVGIELDKDYFKAAKKRFDESTKQEALF